MDLKNEKGIIFKNLDECNKFKPIFWTIGVISILILISLGVLNAFDIFYNAFITAILVIIFILSFLLWFYSNFEINLIDKYIRRKIALEYGKCSRSSCTGNFQTCIDIYEGGIWICLYYISEFKKDIEDLTSKIKSKENTVFESKEGD